jgi:hypothetical protein
MTSESADLLEEARKIRQLLELIAEPAIARRDARLRGQLREIAGTSIKKQQSVLLMDGSRTQKEIIVVTAIHKGDLSTMVGKLDKAGLLTGEKKKPALSISIPTTFFEPRA